MKKKLLIVFLLLPVFSLAQATKTIDSFLGIKFGSNADTVKARVLAKGGIYNEDSTPDMLIFTNLIVSNRKADQLFIRMDNNKAYEAYFLFTPNFQLRAIDFYNDLVTDISAVYGKAELKKIFSEPFREGDGNELDAIKLNKAQYLALWQQKNKNQIVMVINPDLKILLVYMDGKLGAEAKRTVIFKQ